MFQSARIKLTAWYLLIIMIISILFSISFYNITALEIQRLVRRAEYQQSDPFASSFVNRPPPLNIHDLKESEERLLFTLIFINITILVLAGGAGYVLAGETLKPIKEMLDEQNRFIADSSHELRTPLTALKSEMEANLLQKNITDKTARELIKSNLEEVDTLQNLTNNLIKLTQFQNLPHSNLKEKTSLVETIRRAQKKINSLAKQKNIVFINKTKDYTLQINKQSMSELFVIFYDNAIKYSPPHTKITTMSSIVDDVVQISISDQGKGIPSKELPHIFDRFYRVDKSRSKTEINGYGLGLSIAKEIIESNKGFLHVESALHKGTTFIIQFPLRNI